MAIKRKKNKEKLVAEWKLKSGSGHYYSAFLWEDQKSFDENTHDNKPGEAAGCCNHAPMKLLVNEEGRVLKKCPPKKMGEVHFIKDKWNMEIVAHELLHALIGRFRNIQPKLCDIVMQNGNAEETICYGFGEWVDQSYRRLWKEDPA